MANPYWLDNYQTLTLETQSGSTDFVAGIVDVQIGIEWGILESLYTADSVKREAVKQGEVQVPVEIGYAIFDVAFVQEWYDTTGDTIDDTSNPPKFQLTGVFRDADQSQDLNVTVDNIVFENPPIVDGSHGEYMEWAPSGVGKDISKLEEVAV